MPTHPDARRARRRPPDVQPHPKRTPPARRAVKRRRLPRGVGTRDIELRFISIHDDGRHACYRLRLPKGDARGSQARRSLHSVGYFDDPAAAIFHRRCLLRELGCSLDDDSDTIAAAVREWLTRNPRARRRRGRPARGRS